MEYYAWSGLVMKRLEKYIVNIIREEFETSAEDLTYVPSENGQFLSYQS